MYIKELIKELQKLNPDMEITILDGFNGGGQPRTINLGPIVHDPTQFESKELNDYSDIESYKGEKIVILGYGSY